MSQTASEAGITSSEVGPISPGARFAYQLVMATLQVHGLLPETVVSLNGRCDRVMLCLNQVPDWRRRRALAERIEVLLAQHGLQVQTSWPAYSAGRPWRESVQALDGCMAEVVLRA
ncbi:hypothetical protein HNR21_001734 [Actinomadura cellulosilytica]|uniref:Uncharacterized protein n=1 Tax=Thermomonospora cellulosilytica TaxID=1411118 RepID=A0A7W3R7N5_9ACTN|nr:hypothetical protein [Thermomonospora cellulosilytica]